MRLLLDSHVALWWLEDNAALGVGCRQHVFEADEVWVSVVTPWELGIKSALGKLALPGDLVAALEEAGFAMLPISAAHATAAPGLPPHHRDPFDRMLVAQAQIEALAIVTADATLHRYAVTMVDAAQ